ncbi:MAG: glycoside hydrolase family 13 protein [Oscillospiraceae bacterium]|nr:glycoside hydrolase family 13 protein [Oscillospiraceae bacterium]
MPQTPYYDSRDPECKSPFGALKTGEEATITLRLPKSMGACHPTLALQSAEGGEPINLPMALNRMERTCNVFGAVFAWHSPRIWFYHFELAGMDCHQTIMRGPDGKAVLGTGGGWQLTVYDARMQTPACLREGVIYQIFPDRFCNSGQPKQGVPEGRIFRDDWQGVPEWRPTPEGKVLNNDYFGGDLAGVAQKLDYLVSLGVSCIYLNPIFEAHSNHRYNTADYLKIDPMLGNEEDFATLCATAREKGIAVILDGVFSHTGSDSVYFNREGRYGEGGAYRDKASPYYDWFRFYDWPDGYESWWGFYTLPNVEEQSSGYLEFIAGEGGVAEKWLRLGASGYRLDVADELPDVFLDALYARVKAHSPDCAVIGEVWEDASNKVSYGYRRRYLLGAQMDSVMNYPFKDALLWYIRHGGGEGLLGAIMTVLENYPPPVISALMNSLSTHDTMRAITALGGEPLGNHDRAWQRDHHTLTQEQYWRGRHLFALASIVQFGLPGIPCIYYGDEAGMSGYKDPFNRACYPWGQEDTGLRDFIGILGRVRAEHRIFATAEFLPVTFSDEVCSFVRRSEDGQTAILFAVNRSDREQALLLPEGFGEARVLAIYGKYKGGALSPLSGVVLLCRK